MAARLPRPEGLQCEVRTARRADGPGIVSIDRQGVPGVSALSLSDVEKFLRVSACFRVAEHAGVLVAYMIGLCSGADYAGEEFLWFKSRFPDFAYVDQVAVAREARGKGAASALYSDLEGFAAGRKTGLLTLEVNLGPKNRPSLVFHEHHRFAEIGRLETADGRLASLRAKEIA